MKNIFTPRGFLQFAALVLFIAGLFSFVFPGGVLPFIGDFWWFDVVEGYVHLFVAAVAFIGSLVLSDKHARWLVLTIGVGAVITGIFGFFLPTSPIGTLNTFGLANLESPADNIFHLGGGIWALYVVFASRTRRSPDPLAR